MPCDRHSQLLPPSEVIQTPPHETTTVTGLEWRGWTQIEWIPGKSIPPPNQFFRSGKSQRERTNSHELPRSLERNKPPGIVPAQSVRGSSAPPASSPQMSSS